jgi:hypothetical protein
MPVSRYDIPAVQPTGQQFFQLPFNELAASLATKQKLMIYKRKK